MTLCVRFGVPLDLVRLAVPRRVYTNSHLEYVAEVVKKLHREPEKLRGVRIAGRRRYCDTSPPGSS